MQIRIDSCGNCLPFHHAHIVQRWIKVQDCVATCTKKSKRTHSINAARRLEDLGGEGAVHDQGSHLVRQNPDLSRPRRPPPKRHCILLTPHPIQTINIPGILPPDLDHLLQMLGSHMLLTQLRQGQRRPDRISNLPPIQIIGAEILSDVVEQGALLGVREVQVFDEDGPDLSLLFAC